MIMILYLSQFKFLRYLTLCLLLHFCVFLTINSSEKNEDVNNKIAFDFPHGSGLHVSQSYSADSLNWDKNGYIMYCPCMGRFGNQAEQFLGSLAFAKGLNRTLVLPPWIIYVSHKKGSDQIPFSEWFQVEPLLEYHRVITMEEFMDKLAPTIWPPGNRIGFCYTYRGGSGCAMKEGNPFGPFWDNFNIDFDEYREHQGILWDSHLEGTLKQWNERYPASDYPVIALMGAPGSFPVTPRNKWLQKFVKWSDKVDKQAEKFIKENIQRPFVGIHLRNGRDFVNACEHTKGDKPMNNLFASPQCIHGNMKLTYEICLPPAKKVTAKTKKIVKKIKAESVFIATDNDPMKKELSKAIKKVSLHQWNGKDKVIAPIMDLAILTKADYFIGSCVSTFSAFVKRNRDVQDNMPTSFFVVDD